MSESTVNAWRKIVEEALMAGNDMLMITYPKKVPEMVQIIKIMAQKDKLAMARVEAAVRRILLNKKSLGLI